MAKIEIPQDKKGKELYKFLVDNKSAIIADKKSAIKRCDPVTAPPSYYQLKGEKAEKTVIGNIPDDATSIFVKVVANAFLWCDITKDVLIPGCAKKTLSDNQGLLPHIHDHIFEIEAEVGDVRRVYTQNVSLVDLGLNKLGSTEVLIWETDIQKEYNPKIFKRYKEGKIKQHSIGLRYIKIELAINDSDYQKEQDFWNKWAPQVINQEAIEDGYFWVVEEIALIENSCVLRGANILTPTLEVSAKFDTGDQPASTTELPPSSDKKSDTENESHAFDYMKAFKEIKFIN
jgi:hypothetical protein